MSVNKIHAHKFYSYRPRLSVLLYQREYGGLNDVLLKELSCQAGCDKRPELQCEQWIVLVQNN